MLENLLAKTFKNHKTHLVLYDKWSTLITLHHGSLSRVVRGFPS